MAIATIHLSGSAGGDDSARGEICDSAFHPMHQGAVDVRESPYTVVGDPGPDPSFRGGGLADSACCAPHKPQQPPRAEALPAVSVPAVIGSLRNSLCPCHSPAPSTPHESVKAPSILNPHQD